MNKTFVCDNKSLGPTSRSNITVAGLGYVGTSLAALLAKAHHIKCYDIAERPLQCINRRVSPISDNDVDIRLKDPDIRINAFSDPEAAFSNADFVIIATPTNYDSVSNEFDTSSVEKAVENARTFAPQSTIVIKSTVPVGYTDAIRQKFPNSDIIFSPEFLREGYALYDNLFPSRIVVGNTSSRSFEFASILGAAAETPDIPIIMCGNAEAESIKLFSNTYLAMRVAFFNELDTFAAAHGMSSRSIIDGVSLDGRIGTGYNNPSFGYGGYCLPKDTKQLLANFRSIPQSIIAAIVDANEKRKKFIAESVIKTGARRVGVFRLSMKKGSDNFRESSVLDIIDILRDKGIEVVIYEPNIFQELFDGMVVMSRVEDFKNAVDIIIANRVSSDLLDVRDRVFSRDLYEEN